MIRRRVLAPGKVNLGLFLGPLRGDGRHELVTVFQSLSLADELVIETGVGDRDEIVCPGVTGLNLVARAISALRSDGWAGPPVRVSIEKHVPVAAGMGGGSADAAAMLRAAPDFASVDPPSLRSIAVALGADVPAALIPGRWLGTGAGERLEALPAMAPHGLVVVPLEHELSTPDVFREADRLGLGRSSEELLDVRERWLAVGPGERPGLDLFVNDLEPAAISLRPAVAEALEALRAAGADVAMLCGSGPTVAGLWWDGGRAEVAGSKLRASYPRAVEAGPVAADFATSRPG